MTALLATLLLALSAQLPAAEDAAPTSGNEAAAGDADVDTGAATSGNDTAPTNPFATTPTESAAPAADPQSLDPQTPAAAAASEITLPSETEGPTYADPASTKVPTSSASPATTPLAGAAPGEISQTETDAAGRAVFADVPPATATSPTTQSPTTQTAPETSVLTGGPKPAEFMRRLLTAPVTGQLPGIAVSLGDAMAGVTDRSTQTQRAEAYWDLSAAVCQYYVALSEAAELASLRQAVLQPAAAWDVAAVDIAKRVEQTRQTAMARQLRLHRLMGTTAGASLPLPADAPHCGRYNTRYAEIFVTRMDPAARQLNEMLPLLHEELVADVRLVAEATEWMNYVSEHRDPKTDGVGLLRAYELMALRRRDFVETAHQYNLQIAAYTELAAPDQVEPGQLVSMLIRVSNSGMATPGATNDDTPVTPATATEPAGDDSAAVRGEGAPRTFAWRPFERLRNRERSIVTSRRLLRLPFRGSDQN
jgi:hypothetical protein